MKKFYPILAVLTALSLLPMHQSHTMIHKMQHMIVDGTVVKMVVMI